MLARASLLLQPLEAPAARARRAVRRAARRMASGAAAEAAWPALHAGASGSARGARLAREEALRKEGGGETHVEAGLRLFGRSEDEAGRLTFYRDHAAWCPYCQKLCACAPRARAHAARAHPPLARC